MIIDNEVQYTIRQFKNFLCENNIECRYIPKYTPASNGISERINVAISKVLRMNGDKNIKAITWKIRQKLNKNYNTSIKCTPYSLLRGFHFYDLRNRKQNKRLKDLNLKIKKKYSESLHVGDRVYQKNFSSNKLDDTFLGPLEIIEIGKKGFWYRLDNGE